MKGRRCKGLNYIPKEQTDSTLDIVPLVFYLLRIKDRGLLDFEPVFVVDATFQRQDDPPFNFRFLPCDQCRFPVSIPISVFRLQ